ncbi:MAG: SEC-C domain-containing protein, partial [Eubacterium sp.]|nr:SEC-C domain-containing protein [Eubacterium sp.]
DPITMESKYPEEWDFETMNKGLRRIVRSFRGKDEYSTDELVRMDADSLKEDVYQQFEAMYQAKEAEIGLEPMREVERMILLRVVDNLWMDQIDAMDQLKDGIGLRGIGQQDPVAAYAQEGFDMFEQMIAEIKAETVSNCYSVTLQTETDRHTVIQIGGEKKEENVDRGILAAMQGGSGAAEEDAEIPEREFKQETVRRDRPKVGRNDPCPCGSGKKYKNCCMQKDLERERGM